MAGLERHAAAGTMKVAVLAPSFPPAFRGGGPARTLDALTRAAPEGSEGHVFAPDKDAGDAQRLAVNSNEWSAVNGVPTYFASVDKVGELARMYAEIRRIRPEVVYLNSVFNLRFSILPRVLVAARYLRPRAILIAPRGEFDAGALRIKSAKKRLFLAVYRALGLNRHVVWHASSSAEAEAIRRVWGDRVDVLIRENETLLPDLPEAPTAHEGPLRAVFLSRLSQKKGLLTALEALGQVDQSVDLDVYGPEEDSAYVSACNRAADALPSGVRVRFRGAVQPEAARTTLARYDVMVFPTAGENFGHVIAEALSGSCAVMTSDTTPWSDALRGGGGVVVTPNTSRAWAERIAEVARMTPDERLSLRLGAGSAYQRWRSQPAPPHVFELLRNLLAERVG